MLFCKTELNNIIITDYLLVNGLEGVAGIGVDVGGPVAEEDAVGVGSGVGGGDGVGLGPVDAVDLRVEGLHPPQHVVKRPVLLDQNDDRFDGVLSSHLNLLIAWRC